MKCCIGGFYKKLSSHLSFHLDQTCLIAALYDDIHAFLCITKYLLE
jgi:hypothetical protein